ncbi:probable trehalase isoform X1 [Cryptomeria japonica]|uniref:probable trehalase isoform X1 n=1 Tax=Cryptomeria japonica TaxID=3369 RepID=UPI0027DA96CB|nr:probable trehalase isoform X1 [Cryptomeria japonica]
MADDQCASSLLLSFLQQVQEAMLATFGPKDFDPKLYIDLPLRFNLFQTRKAFRELCRLQDNSLSPDHLTAFINEYFDEPGSDVIIYTPQDFTVEPEGFLPGVKHPEIRGWSLQVHSLWKELCRKVGEDVKISADQHTLLYLSRPVIIPGSRFREVYYWDSYWVIRGLLASKMFETAKGIVYNLISLVETYGFVLNGARTYYTNRSQPPLLSAMVEAIYAKTGDISLLRKALPALLQEYRFWTSGVHEVIIKDEHDFEHSLSRYYASWNAPRPECSTIDKETAKGLKENEKTSLYHEIATAAESGWDFGSRWMSDQKSLTTLRTTSIIPVDLNAFLLQMELNISIFANAIDETSIARNFVKAADLRYAAINAIMWNDEMGQWLDYWIDSDRSLLNQENDKQCKEIHIFNRNNQNKTIYASNFVPLWIEPFRSDRRIEKVINTFQRSGLIQPAGISTSLLNTGQQWDFPNGWAPLQHMITEGIAKSTFGATPLAADIARRWVKTNFVAFKQTGAMHEKYDVQVFGETGGGGEYTTQTGFGWSNGVVLALLEEFGWPIDLPID